MGRTGPIETWTGNPLDVGPMYPFTCWGAAMVVAGVAFFIGFMIWKFVTEQANYTAKAEQLRSHSELDTMITETNHP